MVEAAVSSSVTSNSKSSPKGSVRPTQDHIGEALAFALKAALEGGPALATVFTVGIRGARDNMLSSPTTVEAYLSVCDTALKLLATPTAAQIREFTKLLHDIGVCARGVSRASRHASQRSPWTTLAERAAELNERWVGTEKVEPLLLS